MSIRRRSGDKTGFTLLSLALLLSLEFEAASSSAQVLTVPLPSSEGANAFLQVRLADGGAQMFERLRRDPTSPKAESLSENLFQVVGRQGAAQPGEVFLVPLHENDGSVQDALYIETPIGYVAYFDGLGRKGGFGKFGSVVGRPLDALAASDGNFAVLPSRRGDGRTDGVYLYHAGTGRCLWLPRLDARETSLEAVEVSGFPAMTGRVAATTLAIDGRSTAAHLLVDSGNGEIYRADIAEGTPTSVSVRKLDGLRLFEIFPPQSERPSPLRFTIAALHDADGTSRQALIFDAAGGGVGRIDGLDAAPRLIGGSLRFDGVLPPLAANAPRMLSVVPNLASDGRTIGLWLAESTGAAAYVSDPASPADMRFAAVAAKR